MSGRQQGLITKSSQPKSRDGQVEFGYDNLVQQHPDSRSKQPLRYQGNVSPNTRTNREREVTGDPQQRKEYEWHMRNGQGDQVHSRPPPPVGRMEKRPYMDERVLKRNPPRVGNQRGYDYADYEDYNDGRKSYNYAEYEGYNDGFRRPEHAEQEEYTNDDRRRYVYAEHEDYNNEGRRYGYVEQEDNNNGCRRYGYVEHEDYNNETIRKSNHEYGYDDSVQVSQEVYSGRRYPVNNQHGVMARNMVPGEDGVDPQPARLHQDRGHVQGYGRSSQSHPTLEMRRSKEENDCYQERLPEEMYMENHYYEQEKYAPRPRTFSHTSTPPQFNDFGNQYLPKGVPSTSSDVRDRFPGRHQDVDIQSFDGYPRNPGKLSENLGTQEYGQRPQLQPRKDYEAGYADMNCQQCDPYGYSWNEHEDYAYANTESRGKDDPGYITHDGLHRENHGQAQADFEHRYMQRAAIAKPIADSPTEAEVSHRIYGHNGLRELDNSQKEEIPGYEDLRRPFGTASKSATQEADCLNTGYAPAEFAGRASQDIQLNQSSVMHEHETSAYDHGRYANVARTQGERVKSSAELMNPEDIQHVERENRYADEQVAYNRTAKRKYLQDEGARGFSLGAKASHKWSMYNGSRQQIEDCRPEWSNNTSSSGLYSRVPSAREPNLFLEAKDAMDEIYHCEDSERYGLLDQGKCETVQGQSMKSFHPGRKYVKVHLKSESSKGHGRPHYVNHRSDRYNYKQHYVGKRGEYENHMDVAEDHNLLEDSKGPKYGPDENSEGFKQSVLAAFLMFSKKLNEKPPTRKLYKEHGDSGTLFCIVCGRSSSKVFRDTEGLVKHAFMARKATLRAQHLGLHRAICVLMGWDTAVPHDIVKWVPLALPKPEAMAQKEDLILWQPTVIVHNISLSNNNHKEWKVISLEALEGIVRGKKFIRSRVKICLGYPGDQSVMLVKFLGTFTGLQEAEKLHKYFAEKGRGRADFEQAISDMNKNGDPLQSCTQEETGEESLLYGYIGIADDLDRIDLDTKKRCKIQSKREIQVIADAPLTRG